MVLRAVEQNEAVANGRQSENLEKIVSGDKRFVRFSLSDYPASAERLQYFAEKCSKHLYAGRRRQK